LWRKRWPPNPKEGKIGGLQKKEKKGVVPPFSVVNPEKMGARKIPQRVLPQ